ncbi:MAG: hypothetical protein HGA31_03125 [Candidatus Moranbacteria bacterium]|nr:hypothetical protein [Candidatus Moranbacteria bacterium]
MRKRIHFGNIVFFILLAAVVALVFSFGIRGYFRGYAADVPVVVIPLESSVASGREIAGNLPSFFGTDAFRKQFIDNIGERRIFGSGYLTESTRRERFGKMFSVKLYPEGSAVSIRAIAGSPEEAEYLSRQAALALFRFSTQYYNVKTGADFRIVSVPRAEEIMVDIPAFVTVSLSFGIGISGLLFLMYLILPNPSGYSKRKVDEMPVFDTRMFEPRRPISPLLVEEIPESDTRSAVVSPSEDMEISVSDPVPRTVSESIPEIVPEKESRIRDFVHGRKAEAPMNLPGLTEAEAKFLKEFEFENQEDNDALKGFSDVSMPLAQSGIIESPVIENENADPDISEGTVVTQDIEPTKEEYQRRLNDLLRG